MIIRPIHFEDIPHVVELVHRNYDEVMLHHHSPDVIARFRNEITPDSLRNQMTWKHILVIEADDRVIATGAIANFGTRTDPRFCVSQFYVQPDLHGQGIGRLLMERLLDDLQQKDIQRCHVPSSRNAIEFYRKFGFVTDALQPDATDEITWMTKDR